LIPVNCSDRWCSYLEAIEETVSEVKESAMFIDEVLLVGMAVIGLMLVFVGRVGYFVWKDSREYK